MTGADIAVCAAATIKSRCQVYVYVPGGKDVTFKKWFMDRCAEAATSEANDEGLREASSPDGPMSGDECPTQDPPSKEYTGSQASWNVDAVGTPPDIKSFSMDDGTTTFDKVSFRNLNDGQ